LGPLDISSLFAQHPIGNSLDMLQPETVKVLGYGIIQVNFEDGIHTLYLGCLNYGQPDESCTKAAYADEDLTVQQAVSLVGFTSG